MKNFFGALIAFVLLGLYASSIYFAIRVVNCLTSEVCDTYNVESFHSGWTMVLTLVGGLVSALVVAELAGTRPNSAPGTRVLPPRASKRTRSVVVAMTWAYLIVWVIAGLSAVVVGVLEHPDILQPLSDFGQTWLGLAVTTVYAYFGVNPTQQEDSRDMKGKDSTDREPSGV